MRIILPLSLILVLAAPPAWSAGGGVTKISSVEGRFQADYLSLSMERCFSRELRIKDQGELETVEIYEYKNKSPFKAFMFSLAVPGAGEYYVGHKYKAASFLAVDALLWTGYLFYNNKGNDKEDEFRSYADNEYSWQTFMQWWNTLPDSVKTSYSHRLPWDEQNNSPIFNHEYYENIGKYDQFQVGWGADGINHPPGSNEPSWMGELNQRGSYLDMRRQSNDYFSNATTSAMVSIANHIVSAFDAAISAKKFNKGGRQYSMKLKTKNIDGKTIPYLTLTAKF